MTEDITKMSVRRGLDCIGVTVSFVCHDGKGRILLHQRGEKCRDEQGKWDCGGGALEFGEDIEGALRREIKEEYCADVITAVPLGVLNVIRELRGEPTHWISIGYAVQIDPVQASIGEPEKMSAMGWFSPDELPEPGHTVLKRWVDRAKNSGALGI